MSNRVLIACEKTGTLREEFNKLGVDAWSCDVQETDIPGKHIKDDVLKYLFDGWDLMVAFPPCTYITNTANRSFANNPRRWFKRYEAMRFVYELLNAPIHRIALENPVGAISTWIRKPDQYIQPYEYGHPESKKTGLWLKNLPLLQPTQIVEPKFYIGKSDGKKYSPTHYKTSSTNKPEVADLRSKTYSGIAKAMAEQWIKLL